MNDMLLYRAAFYVESTSATTITKHLFYTGPTLILGKKKIMLGNVRNNNRLFSLRIA